jgi:hypothetical protein
MRTALSVLSLLLWSSAAGAAPNPCLLRAEELLPVLGHTPLEGRAERDPFGTPMCVYEMKDTQGRRFLLLVHPGGWDAKRYQQRVALAAGSGLRKVSDLPAVGDAAFFVEGTAGAIKGTQFVEINGLKSAANRSVAPDDAAKLLRIALERLSR